ncbi:unnamed protein product [Gongylonema pulchrum]|uniref:Ribosome-recycling factor, mitochondrial n=1 Tax=Gongylonema pulchrum TaxID=637853 RepID=A0A183D4Z1_9BILA|nr:unnamed protein product [Gongylonema pulchrum]
MRGLENTFLEELTKSLSLKVDLKTYEDVVVKTDDGRVRLLCKILKLLLIYMLICQASMNEKERLLIVAMNELGRIKLVSPLLVSVDFADNPSAIKPARLALEQSNLNVSVRQEGVVIYISIPRITRERRENLANVASKKLLNEYKKALNEVN